MEIIIVHKKTYGYVEGLLKSYDACFVATMTIIRNVKVMSYVFRLIYNQSYYWLSQNAM